MSSPMLTKTAIMNTSALFLIVSCQGEGISSGLARGLLVYYADRNLTGEGMASGVSRSGTMNARTFHGPGQTHQNQGSQTNLFP